MRGSLWRSRWRHPIYLIPLGGAVGVGIGWGFRDIAFGGAAGLTLGAIFGVILALRTPKHPGGPETDAVSRRRR